MVTIFFISISSSFAAFFVEGQGNYMATGEFKPVTGFELGLGFGLTDDVNFLIRGAVAENTENSGLINETRYEYSYATGGIEYIPPITLLEKYRIYWKNSINVGMSEASFEMTKVVPSLDDKETGVITLFRTGLQFNFTQVISPYFDLGYHKFFPIKAGSKLNIKGWQMDVGVRFYVFGSRDYDTGY